MGKESNVKYIVTKKAVETTPKTPQSKEELIKEILGRIDADGEECDLNHIDVCGITDMSYLFSANEQLRNFNGDISEWDVRNVTNMEGMFMCSSFNGDLSKWDVGKVTNMKRMFLYSCFDGNISEWDVSKVTNMKRMFMGSNFNGDLSGWDVSNVVDKDFIFADSPIGAKLPRW